MPAFAARAPRRLGALLLACAHLTAAASPCAAAASEAAPTAPGSAHAAHSTHHHVPSSDAEALSAPCACGCRPSGASGLASRLGPALPTATWHLLRSCLQTRLRAVHGDALAERSVAIDHVPIPDLL